MMESFISSPQWHNLALTLIHFLWQGCAIALVLKLLLAITPYSKAQLRYTWASLAMLSSLVAPIVTFIAIYQPIAEPIGYFANDIAAIISTQNLSNQEVITWYQDVFDTLPYVSILWLAIVCLLAAKLLIEIYHVNQLPNIATVAASEELSQRVEHLASQIGLTKTPQLLISLKAEIPMALGWIKPVILIPVAMLSGLTPAQLDMLILHELAHIRRHDYLVNFIQTLVEILLFFHPCVRWISKQMRNEREYCSDDIAVGVSGTPIAYARTLADTATICSKHRHHAIPTMAMAASGGDLKQRVVRLVDQQHCSSADDSGKFLATVLILFSVVAVLIKPYLNKELIDLSSGHISFIQTANEFIKQQPINNENLSATSIAKLLLKNEQVSTNGEIEQPVSMSNVVQINSTQAQTAPSIKEESLTETVKPQAIPTASHGKIEVKKQKEVDALVEKTNPGISQTEQLLSTQPKESLSELAFKRTDASQQVHGMKNPYAQQVAELVNEPIYQQTSKPINKVIIDKPLTPSEPKLKNPKLVIPAVIKQSKAKPQLAIRKAAKIIASPDPKYPSTAKRRGIELDVQVNFIIDTQGRVANIEFEEKSKVSFFRSAIRTAMAKWRFLPAKINGQPVESKMSKIFSFSLMK
ncbi:hypothetical protein tinsulaeT_15040 [Thalassotalea insulae]|uniref:TonB C-terminal domain-containing protein n=1 Tax=Thalassotalea insulae TaxID=2056778 RepID=A0ABQ6GRB0_9GAMM|nr:M56 family metallopeptidase [Thalassotalea insulae]GLX78164.1 hypothetical protein tinsulaeT_15040 [Thalassotalea insulae]